MPREEPELDEYGEEVYNPFRKRYVPEGYWGTRTQFQIFNDKTPFELKQEIILDLPSLFAIASIDQRSKK